MSDTIKSLSHEQLVELVLKQAAEIERLKAEILALKEQLAKATKTSANSSKPPSSDIVKPKKHKRHGKKKKRGAQKGHPKHESKLTPEDAHNRVDYGLTQCPQCNGTVTPAAGLDPKVLLQYELVEHPVELTAHMAYPFWCKHCQKIHWARIPQHLSNAGIVGPRLAAFLGILKGGCHASVASAQKILDHLGAPIASGTICKTLNKVQQALDPPYQELLEKLPEQAFINIDETGHKDQGEKFWNWCFVTGQFSLFKIADSRSTDVLLEVLGKDCAAVIGTDHYSAYLKFMKNAHVLVQFCMAHLIRELKFIAQSTRKAVAHYGTRLLEQLKKIFNLIHQRDEIGETAFQRKMKKLQKKFLATARYTQAGGDAAKLAKRFRTYGKQYFTFVTQPGIEPTNNIVERAIRFCVIDRKVTQGTRGEKGRKWCERIWTTLATCAQRQVNAFEYIANAVDCYFHGSPVPSLLE